MKNEEIVQIVKQTCSIQDVVVDCIGNALLKCKEEDFKKKIEQTLNYLDCDCYVNDARAGFRIFANQLLKTINE